MGSLYSYLDNLYYGSFMGHYFFSGFALEVIIRLLKKLVLLLRLKKPIHISKPLPCIGLMSLTCKTPIRKVMEKCGGNIRGCFALEKLRAQLTKGLQLYLSFHLITVQVTVLH